MKENEQMKKYLMFLPLFFAAMLVLPLSSCGGDDDGGDMYQGGDYSQSDRPYFNYTGLGFVAAGGESSVLIQNYKMGVTVSSSADWCMATINNQNVVVIVSANTGSSERTCYVNLKYNGESVASLYVTQSGTGSGGGNTGGDNTGGDNTGGGNTGGGNTGGGNTTTKPSAPTGVTAYSSGSALLPQVTIEWNAVNGATNYTVYRSTSASGSYSQIGSNSYPRVFDNNVSVGKTYYYKVKASNSAGSSDYSSYASATISDTRKPGPVTYTSRTVSGGTITLKWKLATDASYGQPDKIVLRVYNPTGRQWADVETLSGTATSVSFSYGMWIDSDGYVRCGVIPSNAYGSGGGEAQVYDTKNKKWIN